MKNFYDNFLIPNQTRPELRSPPEPALDVGAGENWRQTLVEPSRRNSAGARAARTQPSQPPRPRREPSRNPQPAQRSLPSSTSFPMRLPHLRINAARPASRRPGTQKGTTRTKQESAREKEEERERRTTTAWDPRTASPAGS